MCMDFPAMRPNNRKFIHELATYYNLETQSHDKEPNRNVKIYAIKYSTYI